MYLKATTHGCWYRNERHVVYSSWWKKSGAHPAIEQLVWEHEMRVVATWTAHRLLLQESSTLRRTVRVHCLAVFPSMVLVRARAARGRAASHVVGTRTCRAGRKGRPAIVAYFCPVVCSSLAARSNWTTKAQSVPNTSCTHSHDSWSAPPPALFVLRQAL